MSSLLVLVVYVDFCMIGPHLLVLMFVVVDFGRNEFTAYPTTLGNKVKLIK